MSTIGVLKESTNQSSNSSNTLEPTKDQQSPVHKSIFTIKNDNPNKPKDKRFRKLKKENSISIPKQRHIKPKAVKIEHILDFDKILEILNENKDKNENSNPQNSDHKNKKKSFLHKKKKRPSPPGEVFQSKYNYHNI